MCPVPGDDVVVAGCLLVAASVGVGAVDEDLVVDSVGVRGVRDIDEPEWFEFTVQCPA